MPKFISRDGSQRPHIAWAVPIFVGIIIAGLLSFTASTPKGALWISNAAQAELAGSVTLGSEPIPGTKKPVRYAAIIDNWKRYRSATKPDE
jgi:hypothetical protein